MSTLTIRGCDETLSQALQTESKKRGISMNKFVLSLLGEKLLPDKNRYHDDLDHLAGTWSQKDVDEFEEHVADFEKIDPDDWK